jgi:hypothetical protein
MWPILYRWRDNNVLHSQLQTEKDIYERLEQTQRKDMLAQMLLRRIEMQIKSLEERIHGSKRKENSTRRHTSRLIQYVHETVRRLRDYKDRRINSIFQIPAKAILQAEACNQ